MTPTNLLSLLTGALYLVAAAACMIRHVVMRPKPDAWPKTPAWLWHILFFYTAIVLFMGVRLLATVVEGIQTVPPNATVAGAILAFGIALYDGALLVNEARQMYVRQIALMKLQRRAGGAIINPKPLRKG